MEPRVSCETMSGDILTLDNPDNISKSAHTADNPYNISAPTLQRWVQLQYKHSIKLSYSKQSTSAAVVASACRSLRPSYNVRRKGMLQAGK